MKGFFHTILKSFLYFLAVFSRLTWRHKGLVSYGIAMFVLGVWSGSGLEKGESISHEKVAILEEGVEQEESLLQKLSSIVEEKTSEVMPSENEYSIDLVVGKGDTFLNMLIEAGIGRQDAYSASEALGKVYNLKSLRLGQKMQVLFVESKGGEDQFTKLKIEKLESVIRLERNDEGKFTAAETEKKLTSKQVRAGGVIKSSVFQLASDLGIPVNIVMEAIRAYSYDVDFQRDIQPGSRFEVMYEVMFDEAGNRIRNGELNYALLNIGGEDIKIYRYKAKGEDGGYYTEDGRTIRRALLKTPISGARISSRYGMRKHPMMRYSKMHKGVDFAASRGTPVYAAGNGTIERIGRYGAYGKYVKIRHNSTYSTAYAHLNGYAKGMKRGRRVKQGQVIAYVGTTGRSTGPHLHYEVVVNGKRRNPLTLKMTPGKKLSRRELANFNKKKSKIDTLIASLPIETQVASME